MIEIRNSPSNPHVDEAVIFPFDSYSMPFSAGLRLHMVSGKARGRSPIVLKRSESSAPDDRYVRFYGTVIPMEDELRMWYLARGTLDPLSDRSRLCHATSKDGRNWEKPELGLVEYGGCRSNNAVDLLKGECDLYTGPLIHDLDDPDPDRRFKIAFCSPRYKGKVAVAYSPDGLHWKESPDNPRTASLEQTGLIRHGGCYYLNGHGGLHFGLARNLVTYASYDFEHWTLATCLGYQRDRWPGESSYQQTKGVAGEQIHLGAGLWDRGSVVLGVTDLWHGHPSGDRKLVTMDLGLLISHDALHYCEPVPDFRLVPGYEELGWKMDYVDEKDDIRPLSRGPVLSHGQGMCNWKDETLLFYEAWNDGDIRLASWPRDRIGYFKMYDPEAFGLAPKPEIPRHCISCPLKPDASASRVFVNADGLSDYTELTVEVLDEQFRPVPGYSGKACVPLKESGLRQPVSWKGKGDTVDFEGPFRLQLTFGGIRREDIKLFAVYVV